MLLAVLTTVAFVALLIAIGFLTDKLLGHHADQWARRVITPHEPDRPSTAQPADTVALGLQHLSDARTQHELAAAFRELRDSASVQPRAWQRLTAESLLQALADSAAEHTAEHAADLAASHAAEHTPDHTTRAAADRPANHLLADAFKKVLS